MFPRTPPQVYHWPAPTPHLNVRPNQPRTVDKASLLRLPPEVRFPSTQFPVDPRSLRLPIGPAGPQVPRDSLLLQGEQAQPGYHDFHPGYFEDPRQQDRVQQISALLKLLQGAFKAR